MKAKAFIALLAIVAGLSAEAQQQGQPRALVATENRFDTGWNTNSALWNDLVLGRNVPSTFSGYQLGKSGITLSGPLVESLPRYHSSDRSLGQKILDFPLVHLFVPQPMPPAGSPPGKYFDMGEKNQSWIVQSGGGAGSGGFIRFGW